MTTSIAILVGSLRRASVNHKIARVIPELAPAGLKFGTVEIAHLPFYNPDLEEIETPASWATFRRTIGEADAVLFITPEYNRSIPGVLKNAVDVGSRPYGKNVWAGKPAAVISASPGSVGGFGANHHLRQSLVCLDVPVLQQPEAYIGEAYSLFDDSGHLTNDSTAAFLSAFLSKFDAWITIHCRP
ncbi:NADPH-dependent FMN reductase [Neorhizobium sp. T7_12]|uniref:NADPH-dependent FMN reductase n=1 Tax=Neorhizobium sp. T7_12 TaxID=2093832 RepID=UPI0019809A12|nr:NADPH-dependent FMN reductase [Neorhizobium sp. T7_12]